MSKNSKKRQGRSTRRSPKGKEKYDEYGGPEIVNVRQRTSLILSNTIKSLLESKTSNYFSSCHIMIVRTPGAPTRFVCDPSSTRNKTNFLQLYRDYITDQGYFSPPIITDSIKINEERFKLYYDNLHAFEDEITKYLKRISSNLENNSKLNDFKKEVDDFLFDLEDYFVSRIRNIDKISNSDLELILTGIRERWIPYSEYKELTTFPITKNSIKKEKFISRLRKSMSFLTEIPNEIREPRKKSSKVSTSGSTSNSRLVSSFFPKKKWG